MVIGISSEEIDYMFNVKEKIEAEAAALATVNIKDEELSEMRAILEKQEQAVKTGNVEAVKNLDTRFHDIIYSCSGSTTYELILSTIHHKLSKYRMASLEKNDRIINSVREHRQVYEAMMKRDKDGVKKLMIMHIEHAHNSIING